MKKSLFIRTLSVFAALAPFIALGDEEMTNVQKPSTDPEPDLSGSDFVELFNGDDLEGWTPIGGEHKFEVEDGNVTGTCVPGQPNGFLCTDETYTDFIFTAEFKWEELGNSGIQFRSSTKDEDRVFGYQAEMDPGDRRWTGGIYGEAMGGWKYPLEGDERAEARAAIEDHFEWNRMTIKAEGDVLKTWVNGVPVSHLVNNEREEGFFGLQVHSGNQGKVLWRDIRVKELTSE